MPWRFNPFTGALDYFEKSTGAQGPKGDPLSVPPTGCFKVTNIYVDSVTGKVVVEFDNTPAP